MFELQLIIFDMCIFDVEHADKGLPAVVIFLIPSVLELLACRSNRFSWLLHWPLRLILTQDLWVLCNDSCHFDDFTFFCDKELLGELNFRIFLLHFNRSVDNERASLLHFVGIIALFVRLLHSSVI